MSEISSPKRAEPSRRADAERSIAAILDAAVEVLAERPDTSMAGVAAAAGVSRQTVYAHYPSREVLLAAVAERALARTLATIDAAEPEQGPPVEALDRLIRAWWDSIEPNARLLQALVAAFSDVAEMHDFHTPIIERLAALVRRGQRGGDFDERLPVGWATAAFLGLMHAAAHEVAAGRLSAEEAGRALQRTVPRALGVASGG